MRKITNKKAVLALFAICWVAYFSSYLGRLNYSAVISEFLNASILSKTQAGLINTAYFVCYATGQIINGYLGDKISPKRMMTCGLVLSALCNLFMGFSTSFIIMVTLWALNGYFQSMTWPPIIRIFISMLGKETAVKCFTNISSTMAVGTLFSYFISALLLKNYNWHFVFYVPATMMFLAALIFFFTYTKLDNHRTLHGELELNEVDEEKSTEYKSIPLHLILLSPIILLIIFPTIIHGVLKDGLTAWVPTFISETFNAGSVTALLVSMVLPIVNILGAYLVTFLRRWIKEELRLASLFFSLTFIALIILILFGQSSLIISLFCLAVCSCFMLAVNFIFITLVPIQYAKYGRSSTVSGFLNATAYAGAALSTTGIGFLAQNFGWNSVMLSFIIITGLATSICYMGLKLAPLNQLRQLNTVYT
ncbi:MAG: MFS transporter [Turicibacter sp.]